MDEGELAGKFRVNGGDMDLDMDSDSAESLDHKKQDKIALTKQLQHINEKANSRSTSGAAFMSPGKHDTPALEPELDLPGPSRHQTGNSRPELPHPASNASLKMPHLQRGKGKADPKSKDSRASLSDIVESVAQYI